MQKELVARFSFVVGTFTGALSTFVLVYRNWRTETLTEHSAKAQS
jgi:hypothetical protein